ncbi:sirohydrochlorin chelatase [Tuberibacillus sp. Marseille-P3662]|uniref:sirohydrochlorin chelatase n=1 Tax=Tuberibacillus sp. Marseille-P3662 TaxID=1965358 RepID=UPI000A1CC5B5|nr:sirohydrochlorin chelatase [Tuberibacillus sp. Marseille-P3662]
MQGVLYVSHGSRLPEALKEAISFIDAVKPRINASLQDICFLELADPTIQQGIERLVSLGASAISVVPVLLFDAKHYYVDIPHEVAAAQKQFPNISFTYGQPLGVQKRLTDILVTRIREQRSVIHQDASIVLVGRGSRYPAIKQKIESIAFTLADTLNVERIKTCYLAACTPSFDEGLRDAIDHGSSQVFVVPYLWFTGLLMQSMEETINGLNHLSQDIVLCRHLGDHPNIKDALVDRVNESFQFNRDFIT